jgi:hypothetical protein
MLEEVSRRRFWAGRTHPRGDVTAKINSLKARAAGKRKRRPEGRPYGRDMPPPRREAETPKSTHTSLTSPRNRRGRAWAYAALRARSARLQPASCNPTSNHLASMRLAGSLAPAVSDRRERHGQNDVMPGVWGYDLSRGEHLPAVPYYSQPHRCCAGRVCRPACDRSFVRSLTALLVNVRSVANGWGIAGA